MGERISYTANGHPTAAYLAPPFAARPLGPSGHTGAGIVVSQERWELVPHIERIADRFAQAGFVALAPDLYHGFRRELKA